MKYSHEAHFHFPTLLRNTMSLRRDIKVEDHGTFLLFCSLCCIFLYTRISQYYKCTAINWIFLRALLRVKCYQQHILWTWKFISQNGYLGYQSHPVFYKVYVLYSYSTCYTKHTFPEPIQCNFSLLRSTPEFISLPNLSWHAQVREPSKGAIHGMNHLSAKQMS